MVQNTSVIKHITSVHNVILNIMILYSIVILLWAIKKASLSYTLFIICYQKLTRIEATNVLFGVYNASSLFIIF